jgi:hypothetical protein
MAEIRISVLVGPDHSISGIAPAAVTITVAAALIRRHPSEPFDIDALPTRDLGPWPEGLSLRREEIYDEDGR